MSVPLNIKSYTRIPFEVTAVQVTEENIFDVTVWCGGTVLELVKGKSFIKVPVHHPQSERQTRAYVGDWVVVSDIGTKVYTNKSFKKTFEPSESKADPWQEPLFEYEKLKRLMRTLAEDTATVVHPNVDKDGSYEGHFIRNLELEGLSLTNVRFEGSADDVLQKATDRLEAEGRQQFENLKREAQAKAELDAGRFYGHPEATVVHLNVDKDGDQ